MKLAYKLSIPLALCLASILGFEAYDRVSHEIELIEGDVVESHLLAARVFLNAIDHEARTEGIMPARALVEELRANMPLDSARVVRLDGAGDVSRRPRAPLAALAHLATLRSVDVRSHEAHHTYVPLPNIYDHPSALELTRSTAATNAEIGNRVLRASAFTAGIALAFAVICWALVVIFVDQPVERMFARFRKARSGVLSRVVEARDGDELSALERNTTEIVERLAAGNDALREKEEALRHADRLTTVGTLASGVAHELGTPLNVIGMRAKLLAKGSASTPEAITENARIIGEQCDRMTAILRQLLDFARRKGAPRAATVDIVALARDTLDLLAPMAERNHISFLGDFPNEPVFVAADATHLQQVLANLAMNAIQAMERGGTITVGVRTIEGASSENGRGRKSDVCLFVEDHGMGMDADVLKHAFDPFFTTKGIGKGTGLGLSVVHGIVDEYGGRIDVDSRVGEGSRFRVQLPRVVAA